MRAVETPVSIVSVIEYENDRQGVVEAIRGCWAYGGRIHGTAGEEAKLVPFICNWRYHDLVAALKTFFEGGPAPVSMEATFEGQALMVAARKSLETGKAAKVPQLDAL